VAIEEETTSFAQKPKLFGKYSYDDAQITDLCFKDYIAIATSKSQVYIPHTSGRYQAKQFRKMLCPIVERLVGSLQFHGRNTGKKALAIRIVRSSFEIIELLTGLNPLKVFVDAV
jgi:small subunit ribosomal protein S5e